MSLHVKMVTIIIDKKLFYLCIIIIIILLLVWHIHFNSFLSVSLILLGTNPRSWKLWPVATTFAFFFRFINFFARLSIVNIWNEWKDIVCVYLWNKIEVVRHTLYRSVSFSLSSVAIRTRYSSDYCYCIVYTMFTIKKNCW